MKKSLIKVLKIILGLILGIICAPLLIVVILIWAAVSFVKAVVCSRRKKFTGAYGSDI